MLSTIVDHSHAYNESLYTSLGPPVECPLALAGDRRCPAGVATAVELPIGWGHG
jgi:hypothetical protein